MGGPPRGERVAQGLKATLDARVVFHQRAEHGAVGKRRREVEVGTLSLTLSLDGREKNLVLLTGLSQEGMGGVEAKRVEQRTLRLHLSHGHATQQMGAHVVRFGRWRVVHVTAGG